MNGAYRARIVRWVDADTVDALILAMPERGLMVEDRLRLNRIDADKGTTNAGRTGTNYCNVMLPVGAEFLLHVVKKEKFGRLLSEVWLGEINFNDLLVSTGYASYWDGTGARPRGCAPRLLNVEPTAQEDPQPVG